MEIRGVTYLRGCLYINLVERIGFSPGLLPLPDSVGATTTYVYMKINISNETCVRKIQIRMVVF